MSDAFGGLHLPFEAEFDVGALDRRLRRVTSGAILALDTHTAGEPLRIILAGVPLPEGDTILARRRAAEGAWDRYRRFLMYEPRGHADMYGALIVPPVSPGALFGVLFMHNDGYSTGCGHATIALAKLAVDLGWTPAVEPLTPVIIDVPSGMVKAFARVAQGRVVSSGFENVASFVTMLDQVVDVPGLGSVTFDMAYGGAFYAFVDADALELKLSPDNAAAIIEAGRAIKHAVASRFPSTHPEEADLSYLYGTIFYANALRDGVHSRHACVFADGALDRSPTGTGVSARLALLHAKQNVRIGQPVSIEGIAGEAFHGRIARETKVHGLPAVIPAVEGVAYFIARHEFLSEENDPLMNGFLVR